jgi:hypothetical protein
MLQLSNLAPRNRESRLAASVDQVNPAEGSIVSTPDAQPGAAADADDVGSADSSEAIPPWSGDPLTVDVKDLTDYVGQPPFTSDRIYDRTPAGAVHLRGVHAQGRSTWQHGMA